MSNAPAVKTPPLDLDVLEAEATYAPYPFRIDGEEHQLPHVQMLTTEQALKVEAGDAREVLVQIAGAEMAGRLFKKPAHVLNALLNGWMNHGGLDSGESTASPNS